uniref:Homeobox domain-containing protein n=1 Tax=Panagrolaimus sp. PS1159 TaxID=55785 RepID=A0AC35FSG5_9BILA
MPTFNPNDLNLSQFQHQNQIQQRQPEYRIAVTKESAKPLQDWMKENLHHPYPTSEDILELSKKTGFSHKQIRNWFTNNRRRYEQENCEKPLPWHQS